MKNIKRLLSVILILTLIIPSLIFAEGTNKSVDPKKIINYNLKEEKFQGEENIEDDDEVRVVVELKEEPAISFATKKDVEYSNLRETEKANLEKRIETLQESVKREISRKKVNLFVDRNFTTVFNGFSGRMKFEDIEKVEKLPQVKKVYISNEYERPITEPNNESSNDMIGAFPTWKIGYKGEGMVIAVIDSGVDPKHRDMVLNKDTDFALGEKEVNNLIREKDLKGRYYTTKVPYGYNYYDQNHVIKDEGSQASHHGMHVAGIVGANGDVENGGVQGVAPESQILAMKVFSNDPEYATTFDDVYLEAIDEAIKLGANGLNMSLGSPSGFYEYDNPVNVAITNSVNNGLVCAISAGNSGHIAHGWGLPFQDNPDIGLVGTPGLSYDSIQVASIENMSITSNYLSYEKEIKDDIAVLPENTVIIQGKAYDLNYLNTTVEAQRHLVDTRKNNEEVYIKLDENKITNLYNEELEDYSVLPDTVLYYGEDGVELECIIIEGDNGETETVKVPMSLAGNISPSEVFEDEVEFVDCGIGSLEDFEGKEMEGKIALMIRGDLPFTDKIMNAENTGAAGVIIFNHKEGGEELINMAYPDEGQIPAVFIGYNGGSDLLSLKEKYIRFPKDTIKSSNPNGGQMSDFSSWGTTPSLELKPEITAPGGQIYSTLQDDKYGVMSGTSMAAPQVAGGSALVSQYIKTSDKYKGLTLEEQSRLAKILLMNTSNIVLDENQLPYSPRKQGAGIMNLQSAVNTPVRVVNSANNEAKVELKDFDSTTFTMELKAINDHNENITYAIDTTTLTNAVDSGYNLLVEREMDVNVNGPTEITVPAKGETSFSITVDISPDGELYRNMFVEGFVSLVEITDSHPNLSVPFVGFYGDWNEPEILDGMRDLEEESYYGAAGMIDSEFYYMSPGKAAISPGTDSGVINGTDTITPVLSFMRNAEEVKYTIENSEGRTLRTIATEEFVRKNYIDGSRQRPHYSLSLDRTWDGKARGRIVADGLYYYSIKSKISYGDRAEWQEKRIPVYVDTKAPEVENIIYDNVRDTISWNGKDETSGIYGFNIWVNGNLVGSVDGEEGKEDYEFAIGEFIEGIENPIIYIVAFDYAFNAGIYEIELDGVLPEIHLTKPELLEVFNTKEVEFEGTVSNIDSGLTIKIAGEEVPVVKDGSVWKFNKVFSFEDGYQEVKVEAFTTKGGYMSYVRRFFVDTTPPELEVKVKDRDSASDEVELEITMRDNFPSLLLHLWDSEEYRIDDRDLVGDIKPIEKTINIPVYLDRGLNIIPITLTDFGGNQTTIEVEVYRTTK